jgi:uncharacterized protein YwgA
MPANRQPFLCTIMAILYFANLPLRLVNLHYNSYFASMKPLALSPSCDDLAAKSASTVGRFLLTVWYGVIRRRVRPDRAGVERSYRLPLSREQVALVLLSMAEGKTFTPVQIQKALFLADDKAAGAFRPDSRYHFEPYDYGPFDWQVYADVESLERQGLAVINQQPGSRWRTYRASAAGVAEGNRLAGALSEEQNSILRKIADLVRSLSFNELVSAIYKAYPRMQARSVFRDLED